jgi:hypothetical protein
LSPVTPSVLERRPPAASAPSASGVTIGVSFGHGRDGHLDAWTAFGFNRPVNLYALVAHDCTFAVDVFATREMAEAALNDVILDEPDFASLVEIVVIPSPWAQAGRLLLEPHRQ